MGFPKSLAGINPMLLGVSSVVFSYAHNVDQVQLTEFLPALLVVVGAIAVFILFVSLLARNQFKAGTLAVIWLLLFFLHGSLSELIEDWTVVGVLIGRQAYLLLFEIGLGVFVSTCTLRAPNVLLQRLTPYITAAFMFVILFNVASILVHEVRTPKIIAARFSGAQDIVTAVSNQEQLPDVYYLVPDEYGRADVLSDLYGYDNGDFLSYLSKNGFYVAEESRSNYLMTFLSLGSSLNMEHLGSLYGPVDPASKDRSTPYKLMRDNEVTRIFKNAGYRIVHLSSPWDPLSKNPNADISTQVFYSSGPAILKPFATDFGQNFLITTVLRPFIQRWITANDAKIFTNNMERLGIVQDIEGPTFTFGHFLVPHSPYIFDRDGTVRSIPQGLTRQETKEFYIDQLVWFNKSVQRAIDKILSNSKRQSIIIIQSDTGPASEDDANSLFTGDAPVDQFVVERSSILAAYHLPDSCDKQNLYPTITPVNTFRIVFDSCFGTSLGLLPDSTFWSSATRPYDFIPIERLDTVSRSP